MTVRRLKMCLMLLVLAAATTGCRRAMFPKSAPRTQFQTYDAMRHGEAPLTEPDAFGHPQPALRNRLGAHRR
jgi:hypothetical protein